MLAKFTKNWQKHRALSESIRNWPWPITFLSFDVLGVLQSSSFICFRSWMHLWFKGVKIFRQKWSATRELQGGWPLAFWLKDQYLASFSRLSFEYEVRSIIIATIQRYCTGKNAPILSHGDLGLKKIDQLLCGSIPFMIIYQYRYVVLPYRLNYGTIGTCLRKGLCISLTNCEGATTGSKQKCRQLYMKSLEKWWI